MTWPLLCVVTPSQEVMTRSSAQFRVAVPRSVSLSPSNIVHSCAKVAGSFETPTTATLLSVQIVCAPTPGGPARLSRRRETTI